MKPYYEHDGITIYHGDALEVLPNLPPVDTIVTDPPFFLPATISVARREWPRSLSNLAVMDTYFRLAFKAMRDALKPTGALYSFCDSTSYPVFFVQAYPLFDRTHCLVWDKGVGGFGNGWRHAHELILHGAMKGTEYADGFRMDVMESRTVPSAERSHASEKPVGLMARLITAHADGIVLDPFMGGGSTLVAAKQAGRHAIGVELEEAFCEAAAKRLEQGVLLAA